MIEKYDDLTVYNFGFNNPVTFSDPSGADPIGTWEEFWNMILGIYYDPGYNHGGYWNSNNPFDWKNVQINPFGSIEEGRNHLMDNLTAWDWWGKNGTVSYEQGYSILTGSVLLDQVDINEAHSNKNWLVDRQKKAWGESVDKGSGSNWATATLGFIALDVSIIEPTDAAWPKWAGYAIAGAAAAAYLAYNDNSDGDNFYYVTYTKTNAEGNVYVGRSSGYGDPYSVVRNRDTNHHMKNYGPAVLSTAAKANFAGGYISRIADPAYWYTRGAEQIQIELYRSMGKSGNSINGISPNNPKIWDYLDEFTKYKF